MVYLYYKFQIVLGLNTALSNGTTILSQGKTMKKIMVMLLMVVMASLASPLFATNVSPPSFENVLKTNDGQLNVNVNVSVGAAHAEDNGHYLITSLFHGNTLMYSLKEDSDNKLEKVGIITYDVKPNIAKATVAVVCYPRREHGV